MSPSLDSFGARSTLNVGGRTFTYYRLDALERAGLGNVSRLPYSLRILLENLVRFEDGVTVTRGRHRRARRLERRRTSARRRSPSGRRACSCRTSPACRRSSTSRRCATRWSRSAATRRRSTRCSRPSWSSTTRCRSTSTARRRAFAAQRRARAGAQPRALRPAALGPAGADQLQGRAAGHRHRATR